jgi:uncharacterized protein YecE (DUF72 family)
VIRIATAGWSLPRGLAEKFPDGGSSLERYAGVFDAVEINSTFYRSHKPSTFVRWAASVPEHFRFSVKAPREITHIKRLVDCDAALTKFLDETGCLGPKLGPILIQLPPSLSFDPTTAEAFFALFRDRYSGPAACEPRHKGWFDANVEALLRAFRISRVAADPAPRPEAARPGGFGGLVYYRLHGAPRVYYSPYSAHHLDKFAAALADSRAAEIWCVFDNTASGAALVNALDFRERITGNRGD